MDDLEILAKDENKIDSLVKTLSVFNDDIGIRNVVKNVE